jgi:DNA-binding Xre family transcriptional regulator
VNNVALSYNKLWKLLIDKKMKKKDLQSAAGISSSLITKLGRDEPVTMTVLVKICVALQCDIGDIIEVISDEPNRP